MAEKVLSEGMIEEYDTYSNSPGGYNQPEYDAVYNLEAYGLLEKVKTPVFASTDKTIKFKLTDFGLYCIVLIIYHRQQASFVGHTVQKYSNYNLCVSNILTYVPIIEVKDTKTISFYNLYVK